MAGPLILPRFLGRRDDTVSAASRAAPPRVTRAETYLRVAGVNVFRCPVCGHAYRQADQFEPACTGPGATDDHPMAVMELVGVEAARRFL